MHYKINERHPVGVAAFCLYAPCLGALRDLRGVKG